MCLVLGGREWRPPGFHGEGGEGGRDCFGMMDSAENRGPVEASYRSPSDTDNPNGNILLDSVRPHRSEWGLSKPLVVLRH